MTKEEISAEILHGETLKEFVVGASHGRRFLVISNFVVSSQYNQIIAQFEKLLEEECCYIAKDFVMKHRKAIPQISMLDDIAEVTD